MKQLRNFLRRKHLAYIANKKSSRFHTLQYCGGLRQIYFKRFANFLQIALGSTNETDYLVLLAKSLNHLSENHLVVLQESVNKVRAMNINLIEKVRK